MAVLGINPRAACFSHFSLTPLRNQLFPTFLKGDAARARIDADNGHRRVTRPRLRIIEAEQGYPTGYLRAPSDAIKHDRESRKVSGARAEHEAVFGYRSPCSGQRSAAERGEPAIRLNTRALREVSCCSMCVLCAFCPGGQGGSSRGDKHCAHSLPGHSH